MWFRRAVAPGLTLFLLAIALSGKAALGNAPENARFVPPPGIDGSSAGEGRIAPNNGALLMVVNASGRIGLFEIIDPNQWARIAEIAADAKDVAFTPKGTSRDKVRIVSGGGKGTLRSWTLDGQPPSELFKGHAGTVTRVAFSLDGAPHRLRGPRRDDPTVGDWRQTSCRAPHRSRRHRQQPRLLARRNARRVRRCRQAAGARRQTPGRAVQGT